MKQKISDVVIGDTILINERLAQALKDLSRCPVKNSRIGRAYKSLWNAHMLLEEQVDVWQNRFPNNVNSKGEQHEHGTRE